tara:strand:- start:1017 stop:1346 length:330 start_codon:yes stop_codon:yes gene_type:complete
MKLWNENICVTNRKSIMIITIILFSTLVIANVWPNEEVKEIKCNEEMWIPTAEDIAYQDSMYQIIQNTQSDIDTIKQNIVYILERLDYKDGTYDSIRYVKGGKIDRKRN